MHLPQQLVNYCHLVWMMSDPTSYSTALHQLPLLVEEVEEFTKLIIFLTAIQSVSRTTSATNKSVLTFLQTNLFQDLLEVEKQQFISNFIEIASNRDLISIKFISEDEVELHLTKLGRLLLFYKKQNNLGNQSH